MAKEYNGRSLEVFAAKRPNSLFFIALNPNIPRKQADKEFALNNPCKVLERFKVTIGIQEWADSQGNGTNQRLRCNMDYAEWVGLANQVKRSALFQQFNPFTTFKCHNMIQDAEGKSDAFQASITYQPQKNKDGKYVFGVTIREGKATTKEQRNGARITSHFEETKKAVFYLAEGEMLAAVEMVNIAIDMYVRAQDPIFKEGLNRYLEAILKGRSVDATTQSEAELNEQTITEPVYTESTQQTAAQQPVFYGPYPVILLSEFWDTTQGPTCQVQYFDQNKTKATLVFPSVTDSLRRARESKSVINIDVMQNGQFTYGREHIS